MNDTIHICSLNCQGLGQKEKRERLNLWKENQNCSILFIQESHFTENIANQLESQLQGQCFHSFGTSQSRGVSIVIKNQLEHKIINEIKDHEGRIILLNIDIKGSIFTFVNIYAPNIPRNRNIFFKKLSTFIENNRLGVLIVGGDMNETFSNLDIKNSKKNKKPVHNLKLLVKKHKLIDIWRDLNPNNRQFTWQRKSNKNEATRIDFYLISPDIRPQVISTDIRPAMISYTDHQAISLKFRHNPTSRGRGFFKINNSILINEDYKMLITNLINNYKDKILTSTDICTLWDLFKTEVRDVTLNFCKQQAAEKKNKTKILELKLQKLNEKLNNIKYNSKINDIQNEIDIIEKELENIYITGTKGAQIRSRVKWIEEGEKNTKFFLGLEKSRQIKKNILALRNDENTVVTNQSEILKMEKIYYENLYKSAYPSKNDISRYIGDTNIDHKLTDKDADKLGGELTVDECTEAIFNMKLNKSPGIDGLSVEFYRTFWPYLKHFIVQVFNQCYNKGELTSIQKIGVISLLYKKNDPLSLNNYRPITLLNVDTKLIAYAISQRIKPVLSKIIHSDQTGYIKNRYIGFNVRQIQDIIDHAEKFNVEGAVLFVDFSKAFDSLEWDFMYESLKKCGFPEYVQQWVKTL